MNIIDIQTINQKMHLQRVAYLILSSATLRSQTPKDGQGPLKILYIVTKVKQFNIMLIIQRTRHQR